MTEKQLQNEILETFGSLPWMRLVRLNVGKFRAFDNPNRIVSTAAPGWPDLIGFLGDGRMVAIEVKGPKGRLSKQQQAFKRTAERFCVLYVCAKSTDDVWNVLRDNGYCD